MLNKFNESYMLEVSCFKIVHEDDFFEGQGSYIQEYDCDWMTKRFDVNNKTDFANLIVDYFNDSVCLFKDYDRNSFCIVDNRICTSTTEDNEGCCVEGKQEDYEKEKLYICDYNITLKINGKSLDEEDLINITKFTS